MTGSQDKLTRGRMRRGGKLATGLSPRSARLITTLVTSGMRSPEKAAELLRSRHVQLADAAVEVLGTLRGGAMKVGQLASFIDIDVLPEAYRDLYRDRLSVLQAGVQPMSFEQVRPVLEGDLGGPVESFFESFEYDAVAAASVGQVHRATLSGGRLVAVKVQYPGVAEAIRSDLQLASVGVHLARLIAPGVDPAVVMGELRERLAEELDFEREADQQQFFADAFRGHPYIHIPEVHRDLTRPRVMVSDWVDGVGFDEVRTLPQVERDRFGEIVYRFFFGTMHHLGRFHADPHPGNYLLRADGSVAFLDFGSVREISPGDLAGHVAALTATCADDAAGVAAAMGRLGYLRNPETADPDLLLRLARDQVGWFAEDRAVRITRDYVAGALGGLTRAEDTFKTMRTYQVPAGEIMLRRVTVGTLAVLGQLSAEANWHRIGREWWYGEAPATVWGELERAHFANPVA